MKFGIDRKVVIGKGGSTIIEEDYEEVDP